MRRSELNKIITRKISELDESEHLKSFLLDVLENELKNLSAAKGRYTDSYKQWADGYSQKEHKDVDL